jgi:hypothetical protein
MAMDCVIDPYGIEGWGCPVPGHKRTKSRCTLAKRDWVLGRYPDGKESWYTVPGFNGTPRITPEKDCPDWVSK